MRIERVYKNKEYSYSGLRLKLFENHFNLEGKREIGLKRNILKSYSFSIFPRPTPRKNFFFKKSFPDPHSKK